MLDVSQRPDSFSSALMMGVTVYRNDTISGRFCAVIAYPCITVIALVESAVAAVFVCLSLSLYVFSEESFQQSLSWFKSSSFTIIWSIADTVLSLNPFIIRLAADEVSAKEIYLNGRIFEIPRGALV
ncbi:MAG: hypothetical protein K940chlam3_01374 [Chlamydiae bacterium]|nr:hypothetical protein [Chlamydiota bacterium]